VSILAIHSVIMVFDELIVCVSRSTFFSLGFEFEQRIDKSPLFCGGKGALVFPMGHVYASF
jgi:hypothetical protein